MKGAPKEPPKRAQGTSAKAGSMTKIPRLLNRYPKDFCHHLAPKEPTQGNPQRTLQGTPRPMKRIPRFLIRFPKDICHWAPKEPPREPPRNRPRQPPPTEPPQGQANDISRLLNGFSKDVCHWAFGGSLEIPWGFLGDSLGNPMANVLWKPV